MDSSCTIIISLFTLPVWSKIVQFPLIPHANHVRRLSKPPQQVASLYAGYGTHYVDVWVGTPEPQRQTVIVDTGSQLTAFPCTGCSNCGEGFHTDKYFNYEISTTFEKLACPNGCVAGHCYSHLGGNKGDCHMGLSYQEGSSWGAFEARDVAYVGGKHNAPVSEPLEDPIDTSYYASEYSFPMVFGCQTSLTGLFKTQLADGIMGMSMEKAAYWKQMYAAGTIDKKIFSLCFNRQDHVEKDGTLAGAMTLGGVDEKFWETPIVWAKKMNGAGFYEVHVRKMYLREGGTSISAEIEEGVKIVQIDVKEDTLNRGAVIVDSGTTDTYLNADIQKAFKKIWKEIVGKDYSNSEVSMSAEQVLKLPTLLVQLKGVDNNELDPNTIGLAGNLDPENKDDILIAMPPTHYMETTKSGSKYASRLYINEHGGTVLGGNFMMGHDIVFDMENNRVGFAESDCDYNRVTGAKNEVKSVKKEIMNLENEVKDIRSSYIPLNVNSKTCSGSTCHMFVVVAFLLVAVQVIYAMNMARIRHSPVPTDENIDEVPDESYCDTELVATTRNID